MATAKNKLPTFGTNASVDSSIVNGTSELANTGFQANTIIRSAQVNTYLKVLMNNVNGLIDAIYNAGASQGEISATSSSDDVKNYITAGLSKIIAGTKVDNAIHADEATNADEATKLETARTISLTGDATGEVSFDGTDNAEITVDVAKSAALDSTNVGDATHPVYFNDTGKPVVCSDTIANNISGNAASANKLNTNVGNSKTPVYFSGGVPVACDLLNTIYPVGSIYMSTNDNSPGNFLGGTWEKIEGRFLLGAGDGYNAGSTGGEATHTLSTDEMPSHNHTISAPGSYASGGGGTFLSVDRKPVVRSTESWSAEGTGGITGIGTLAVGKGTAHNNMPPYLVVYIRKRTA